MERWHRDAHSAIGIFAAGDPAEAARLAGVEAQVSHGRDGIYCGQAIAASVATALVTDSWRDVVDSGLAFVPRDSWTHRLITEAVQIGSEAGCARDAVDPLYDTISLFHYPWADVGPEATALAYGLFAAAKGEYVDAVLGGVNIGRDADTIAAMCGAMAGALHGAQAVPRQWRDLINIIPGRCIKQTAGTDLKELATRLHSTVHDARVNA